MKRFFPLLFWVYPTLFVLLLGTSCSDRNEVVSELPAPKELYIPDTVWMVPPGNDYTCDTSEFAFARMRQSENIALFWSKEYGTDPTAHPDTLKRFRVDELVAEGDRIYRYYVDTMQFVEKGKSVSDRYKQLIYIIGGEGGTAFGGGEDEKVGIFWAPAVRMHKPPYGALAHEMGHSFQYFLKADSFPTFTVGYAMYEMTCQYMLWQVYPEWMTFENYHLVDFMKQTHYAFLHEINMYHSPYVLEYWSDKHGPDFIGKLWREAREGEDAVETYQRITEIGQEEFNDEIFDAARRFITWDLKRIQEVARPYRNQHSCLLDSVGGGWYRVAESRCPQDYGYNGIRLAVPETRRTIRLQFKGIPGADGFHVVDAERAGWRYGFLAYTSEGKRVYGAMHSASEGEAGFKVPANTEYLWLVVTGAPAKHEQRKMSRRGEGNADEQWPYEIKLTGTSLLQ